MKTTHRAYVNARESLDAAQAALWDAQAAMRAAEEDVAEELNVAWNRNQEAVTVTQEAIAEALRRQAQVETEIGEAARRRPLQPDQSKFTEQEIEAIVTARAAVEAARVEHEAAVERFKAGVTVEQLAEAEAELKAG